MSEIVRYMAHDPISNTEAQVMEFDPALLNTAAAQGIIFIAVDSDGMRSVVDVSEVVPPDGVTGSFTLVEPVYVDDRMQAVVDVFDALQAIMFPETALLETDMAQSVDDSRDPIEVFSEKLTALRTITKAGESR